MKLIIALVGLALVIISFVHLFVGEEKLEKRSKRESRSGRS